MMIVGGESSDSDLVSKILLVAHALHQKILKIRQACLTNFQAKSSVPVERKTWKAIDYMVFENDNLVPNKSIRVKLPS